MAKEAAGELSDSLSDLSADIYGGNFQRERDRQLGAANTLNQGFLTERGLQEGASRDLLSGFLNERGLQQDAATTLGEQGIRASAVAPSLAGLDFQDLNALLNVGNQRQDQNQAYIGGGRRK